MVLYCLFKCHSFGEIYLMFVHIIFDSFLVAEWPPFGKEPLTQLTICSFCILTVCN